MSVSSVVVIVTFTSFSVECNDNRTAMHQFTVSLPANHIGSPQDDESHIRN